MGCRQWLLDLDMVGGLAAGVDELDVAAVAAADVCVMVLLLLMDVMVLLLLDVMVLLLQLDVMLLLVMMLLLEV